MTITRLFHDLLGETANRVSPATREYLVAYMQNFLETENASGSLPELFFMVGQAAVGLAEEYALYLQAEEGARMIERALNPLDPGPKPPTRADFAPERMKVLWQEFTESTGIGAACKPNEISERRRMYYAGAAAMHRLIEQITQGPKEAAPLALEELRAEMLAFVDAMERGKA